MTVTPKAWADSMLVAYVDDELDPAQRTAVEQTIQADPEAQAIVSVLKRSAMAVKAAFDEPLAEPVPRRLLDAINAGDARSAKPSPNGMVVPFERRRAMPRLSRVLLPLAASLAALAIGFAAGVGIDSGRGKVEPASSSGNSAQSRFEETLFQALESGDPGVQLDYQDAASGISGTVTVTGQVSTTFGGDCREFQHVVTGASAKIERGLACRGDNNAWQVLTVPGNPS